MHKLNKSRINIEKFKLLFDELYGIDDEKFSKLISCLENTKPFKNAIEALQTIKKGINNYNKEEGLRIIELLEQLYLFGRKYEGTNAEDLIDLVYSVNEKRSRNIEKYINRTQQLKSISGVVNLLAKSKDLWQELPRKLQDGRVLTDFRPFFSDGVYVPSQYGPNDGEMTVENGSIIHTLVLAYEESSQIKEFHLSLDKQLLWSLQSELTRALKKEDSLRKMMEAIDVHIHNKE